MKKRTILPLFLTLAGACLLFAKVSSDYDHAVDFGKYHTYSWIRVRAQDPFWNDRISNAVNNQLVARGWQQTPSGGDASIAAFGATRERQTLQTWYDGFGGRWSWRRGWGGPGIATTTVEETPVGTLMIDIFDTPTQKLMWRGVSSETLSSKPEKNEDKLEKAIEEMFKKFPPREKG